MNDRFRFRAWDKSINVLRDSGTFDLVRGFHNPSFIVEQCTGLKDASGRLIYEGDLLLLDPDDPPSLVVWDKCVATFRLGQEDVDYTFDNCGYSPQEMEIVGNIHENPELLEDK